MIEYGGGHIQHVATEETSVQWCAGNLKCIVNVIVEFNNVGWRCARGRYFRLFRAIHNHWRSSPRK